MLNKNFNTFPILKTERLIIRQLEIGDEQEIFTLRSDDEINKYLDRPISHTLEEARNFIIKINEYVLNNDALYWALTLGDDNTLVGTICLYGFSDENLSCEIGYELLTNFQGQGIMQEAAKEVIYYAFNTIKVQKIEASLHKDNQCSIQLLDKLSFKKIEKADDTNPQLVSYYLKR
ncbi:GNAT family N-acetyltransferase [Pedobacter frigiditerrae]|uniref:GNAT family N-acetyltransferase n=1 Tax=Pedobacter frigiditerrae TaxID=2530452 RepID=UPI00292CD28F|nr:GNAT family N-acetyltransferase [Pedobacter frigiditerrae]